MKCGYIDNEFLRTKNKFEQYKEKYGNSKLVFLNVAYYFCKLFLKKFPKTQKSNTWYKIGDKFNEKDVLSCTKLNNIIKEKTDNYFSHIYMDIDRALKLDVEGKIKGIYLVFFMGIGDYFYATRFIEDLKKKYKDLEINAFVSKNTDKNNNPLVAKIMEYNPNINKIEMFDGTTSKYWRNYDYSDCYNKIDDSYLLCPMVYEHNRCITSRYRTLCETFSMEPSAITLPPIIYNRPETENVKTFFEKIKETFKNKNPKAVVFIQLTSRSSNYSFKDKEKLIKKLLDDNFLIISVEKNNIENDLYFEIDIKKFNINESIKLLNLLKENFETYCLTLVSLFWSISSGLDIYNLGIQHYYDPNIKTVYFPNIFVVGSAPWEEIPSSRLFVAKKEDCTPYMVQDDTRKFADYKADFIYKCFLDMIKIVKGQKNG